MLGSVYLYSTHSTHTNARTPTTPTRRACPLALFSFDGSHVCACMSQEMQVDEQCPELLKPNELTQLFQDACLRLGGCSGVGARRTFKLLGDAAERVPLGRGHAEAQGGE
mmetsp:Transcript_30490/g.66840  ORF Transcript_30490/g.66840 Transcript_30490/m.66840 type:complete len:110 (+) Transcript_30490:323-652(+)